MELESAGRLHGGDHDRYAHGRRALARAIAPYAVAWPYDRPTWASAAVLFIARPDRGYFELSEPGTVVLPKTGHPQFTPASHGRHRYLKWDEKMKMRALEAILLLASQPPAIAKSRSK